MNTDTLPTTLSGWIRLAVRDVLTARSSPDVVIDMSYWAIYQHAEQSCVVCFAGSVMMGTFDKRPLTTHPTLAPSDFGDKSHIFHALDCVQRGDMDEALDNFGDYLNAIGLDTDEVMGRIEFLQQHTDPPDDGCIVRLRDGSYTDTHGTKIVPADTLWAWLQRDGGSTVINHYIPGQAPLGPIRRDKEGFKTSNASMERLRERSILLERFLARMDRYAANLEYHGL